MTESIFYHDDATMFRLKSRLNFIQLSFDLYCRLKEGKLD